jgi:hypothetical protein
MSDLFLVTNCLGYNSLCNAGRGNCAPADAKEHAMKTTIRSWGRQILAKLRELGPYMAIELILPGGSIIALGLWLYHRKYARALT